MINKIFHTIWDFIKLIFKFILYIIKSVKFIFRIPLTSIIAMIFAIAAIFLYRLILIPIDIACESLFKFDLTANFNYPLFDSLIGAIIYIILNCALFEDAIKNNKDFHPYRSLLYFAPTIIIWMIPILKFKEIGEDTLAFLSQPINLYEPFYSYVYIAFYGPHMWAAFLTDSLIGIAIGLAINNIIYIIRSYLIVEYPKSV